MSKTKTMTVAMAIMLGSFVVSGCATTGFGEGLYEAPRLRVEATQVQLHGIVSAYAVGQGWTIVNAIAGGVGVVEALSPALPVAGMQMRNRWFFWLADNELLVEKRLEVKFDSKDEVWQSSTEVCDTYVYENELLHLKKIAALSQDLKGRLASTGM